MVNNSEIDSNSNSQKQGLIIIFTGPSGCGKNTIIDRLIADDENNQAFVTATTRSPRDHEEYGVHYYFKSEEEFKQGLENGDFLEWSKHYNNFYGTLRSDIESRIFRGVNALGDVTWSGAKSIRDLMPENTLCLAILPPSAESLRERLLIRQKDTGELSEGQKQRLEKISIDMEFIDEDDYIFTNPDMYGSTLKDYNYVITNNDLETAITEIKSVVKSELKKRS